MLPPSLLALLLNKLVALISSDLLSAFSLIFGRRIPSYETPSTPPQERAYYLEKTKNLYIYCLDKNDQDCVLGFVDHHLSKEPEELDVVHDLLAFLAQEMIRLNKEKHTAQREFLDWL